MLIIDGSFGEGGGQIIRTALALSALTGIPFQANRIRHNRPKPGLKNQHLSCIGALSRLAGARTEGAVIGSDTISFFPGPVCHQTISLDIGTAGSITLLLQSVLLPSLFADGKTRFIIKGGTDTRWSIPLDYFREVILPFFSDWADIQINAARRGFYPKGNGIIDIEISPKFHCGQYPDTDAFIDRLRREKSEMNLTESPRIRKICGISCASKQLMKSEVAQRQSRGASDRIGRRYPVQIQEEYQDTVSSGTVITLWAQPETGKITIGGDALGERGVRAERVGENAASQLLNVIESGAALDSHLADNLIPLLALVGGVIQPNDITDHILSNIYVCEKFLNIHFDVDPESKHIRVVRSPSGVSGGE